MANAATAVTFSGMLRLRCALILWTHVLFAAGLLASTSRTTPQHQRLSQSSLHASVSSEPTIQSSRQQLYTKTPGKLILIRHGESVQNANDSFSGWIDGDLSTNGCKEMEHAGRLMLETGYAEVDVVYTSRLKRAIRSAWTLLKELNSIYRPLEVDWRLNQRHFGALEGVKKQSLVEEIGEERVQEYRHSLYARPPPMSTQHPNWHQRERKYADLNQDEIPTSESVYDCWQRTTPFFEQRILSDLMAGKTVLVVAHANSLRGLIRIIDGLGDGTVQSIALPSGIPLVYSFDNHLKPIPHANAFAPMSACFLESNKALKVLLQREKAWGSAEAEKYKGLYSLIEYDQSDLLIPAASGPLMQGLSTLEREREVFENVEARAAGATEAAPASSAISPVLPADRVDPAEFESTITGNYIVFIRHGQTVYNRLGIFTGWDDAPLSDEGRKQAHEAGRLLKLHGIEFDVVYTSWLSRAIETAWAILDELDCLWLPIVKSWRLNERMYGALTGMSKKGIAERFGASQLKAWRRGYDVQPPPVHSFSLQYPGNDERYFKYVTDLRVSISESIMRSISKRRLEIHRKFPKTESLRDCMARTIPFFQNDISKAAGKGKRVLVASSENAIRGLLMHLCEIPPDRIHEVDIPNALPLVFNLDKKCVQILDDGRSHGGADSNSNSNSNSGSEVQQYNFGESPELLFKPCDYQGGGDQCFLGLDGKSYAYDPVIRLRPRHRPLPSPSPPPRNEQQP